MFVFWLAKAFTWVMITAVLFGVAANCWAQTFACGVGCKIIRCIGDGVNGSDAAVRYGPGPGQAFDSYPVYGPTGGTMVSSGSVTVTAFEATANKLCNNVQEGLIQEVTVEEYTNSLGEQWFRNCSSGS